jgi:hypothetical protein
LSTSAACSGIGAVRSARRTRLALCAAITRVVGTAGNLLLGLGARCLRFDLLKDSLLKKPFMGFASKGKRGTGKGQYGNDHDVLHSLYGSLDCGPAPCTREYERDADFVTNRDWE